MQLVKLTGMKLGKLMRTARESNGWSLREAANRLGAGYGHLCDMENEKGSNPTVATLYRAHRIYGITKEAIFDAAIKSLRSTKRAKP